MRDAPPITKLIIPGIFVLALFMTQLRRQEDKIPLWRVEGSVMGTTYRVQVVDPKAPDAEQLHAALEAVNQRMSTYLKTSELSQLNQRRSTAPTEVSEPLSDVLGEGLRVGEQSGGAFDVTIGPLVNAWGFGPDGRVTPPTQEALQMLKAHMGYQKLSLIDEGRQVVKQDPELYIDLSGIAKGYGVDQAADYLKRAGYSRYWVEVGGEVKASGLNAEDQLWRAGIERPAGEGRRAVYMVLPLKDTSIATSGDYRNRYIDPQGVLRSHTIDPRTGSPITHQLASVSVIAERNTSADAWATALNVLGPEEGLKVANAHQLAALFLVRPEGASQGDLNSPLIPLLSEAMKSYLQEVGAQLPE